MFVLGDNVEIIESGKTGEIVDISSGDPPTYAVEWEDGDSFDISIFFAEDLRKSSDAKTA